MTLRPRDWTCHSPSQRTVTVRGRHFLAARGRFFWRVAEVEEPKPDARELRVLMLSACTKDLSGLVMKATKEPA